MLPTTSSFRSICAASDSDLSCNLYNLFTKVNSLYNSSVCAVLVSEELEDPIIVEAGLAGKYPPSLPPYCQQSSHSNHLDLFWRTGWLFSNKTTFIYPIWSYSTSSRLTSCSCSWVYSIHTSHLWVCKSRHTLDIMDCSLLPSIYFLILIYYLAWFDIIIVSGKYCVAFDPLDGSSNVSNDAMSFQLNWSRVKPLYPIY